MLGKNPGDCKGVTKLTDAIEGTVFSQLCCALPAITASIPPLLHMAINNNNVQAHLPEGITPYNSKDHAAEPDTQALAYLPDEALQERLRNNAFHIEDTKDSLESTKLLRTTLKAGSALAATIGTAALTHHITQQRRDDTQGAFDNAVHDVQQPKIPAAGQDVEISSIIKQHTNTPLKAHLVNYKASNMSDIPDYLSLQLGRDCCPGTNFYPEGKVGTLINAAKQLTGNNAIATNQNLFAGGISGIAGMAAYSLAERLVDNPAREKISMLKRENETIETILEAKKSERTTNHSERIAQEKNHLISMVK